jgi:acetate---CoA ligase (ADP-forming)
MSSGGDMSSSSQEGDGHLEEGESRPTAGSLERGPRSSSANHGDAEFAEALSPAPGLPPPGGGEEPSPGKSEDQLRRVLFFPRSVAVIGQSNDVDKAAGRPLKFLRQAGFAGRVYAVNARQREVLSERAWPSVEALPEIPEHVYVVTPVAAAMEVIEACGRIGVAVATVLTDGFGETGEAGRVREAQLRRIAATTGMRIVGPSSLGIVNLRNGALITANAAFDEPDLPVGRIFAASHSGSMIGTLLSRGKACGIGFAGMVSVGGEADLSLGEICDAMLGDHGVDGYVLFLETLRHAGRLRAFALRAAAASKPVLAYKLGRSPEGRELAITHTGALAGEDEVADAFLRDCGIARVETLSALIEGLPLLTRIPVRKEKRRPTAAVVTTTAGGAATVVDPLASRDINVTAPSAATLKRLAAAGVKVAPARIIDLTLAGARYDMMKGALDVLTTAPEFDIVVVVVGSSARLYPHLTVQPIVDSAGSEKRIAVFLAPEAPQARAALAKAGVANFYTPEACADAVAAALLRRLPREAPGCGSTSLLTDPLPRLGRVRDRAGPNGMDSRQEPPPRPCFPGEGGGTMDCVLDELQAYALLDRLGIPRAPSLELDMDAAEPLALPFGYPIVLKVLSSRITHKSDVGGVTLDVGDARSLAAAVAAMRVRLPEARRFLVQPMIDGVGEVLIGYRVDPEVGPLVMVAAGGIYSEIYRDRSLRLAPVDVGTAAEMVGEVQGLKVLAGHRGRPAGDFEALAHAIAALSQLAADPAIIEAEVNPLIVRPRGKGAIAVDAVVRLR